MKRSVRAAAAAIVVLASAAGCSSSRAATTDATVLKAADIPAAVAAVAAVRGASAHYTEINVTPDGVNLFVAVDQADEVSYFYARGALGPAGTPVVQSGTPFGLDGVALDRGLTMIATSQNRFAGSLVVGLSLVEAGSDGLVWIVRVRSPKGGFRNEYYDPAGSFRYADLDVGAPNPAVSTTTG